MPDSIFEQDYDDRLREIARQVSQGIKRRQVILGGEHLAIQIRRQQIGMVWATVDLSRHTLMKIKILCLDNQIPILIAGSSEQVAEQTANPRVKIYLLKKSFSGIQRIIRIISRDEIN
jgi:ribosomal protein L7Ae-like RNA K-turn-binding protein